MRLIPTVIFLSSIGIFALFNLLYIPHVKEGCAEFNCTYVYAGQYDNESCYYIYVDDSSLCRKCFSHPPINGSRCYNINGQGMDGYLDCPYDFHCYNWDRETVLIIVDIFAALAIIAILPLGYFHSSPDTGLLRSTGNREYQEYEEL